MFDTVLGLPVHVLVVHAVVVGLPLMAVVTAVVALMPALRLRFAWPVVVLDAGVVVATFVARESGEVLQQRLGGSVAQQHGVPRAQPAVVRRPGARRRGGGGADPPPPPVRPRRRRRRRSPWWRVLSRSGGPSASATPVPRPSGRASSRAPTTDPRTRGSCVAATPQR